MQNANRYVKHECEKLKLMVREQCRSENNPSKKTCQKGNFYSCFLNFIILQKREEICEYVFERNNTCYRALIYKYEKRFRKCVIFNKQLKQKL